FFFQAEDGIRDFHVTGVQTCALPISAPQHAHVVAAFEQQQDRAHDQRQQDRSHDQVLHHSRTPRSPSVLPGGGARSGSRPSTWSLRRSAWLRIATTTTTAVIAKAITIAVSTSACGSGSV